ncbi:cytoskeletal protein CcmA (bactofilin family) [Clostridiales Family XIII bacterium PM5-7]
MTAISNFTQAVRELTGFDDNGPKEETTKLHAEEESQQPKAVNVYRKPIEFELGGFDANGDNLITRSMVITGQMDCKTSLKVEGKLSGEIHSTSDVSVEGVVVGNVNAQNLIATGKIKGDVLTKENTKINHTAIVVGDVQSDNVFVYGKIKGNLNIKDSTDVSEDAYIVGDITTRSLVSSRGSIIDGKIIVKDKKPVGFNAETIFNIEE